jgi:prevent-host-death family protein
MTATLSKSQADLPRLVEIASQGEDVVITVEGKPKARLTRAEITPRAGGTDLTVRVQQLAALRERYHTGKTGLTVDQIMQETRADRP